ncbi:DUF4890 domain-containing protein [Kriegella aquimaris]|uniref:LTXXQ motif family protein n=1 Tax=Kriegella aquimaris TaxID=192904 RepID=A0A1G9UXV9_9FLAO|nr:DUF4890 domain-containing protein [Kriegella aquimaris]SDM64748.1 hypothetical protein SAMN04488514_11224 [Kriegella aquimaris]
MKNVALVVLLLVGMTAMAQKGKGNHRGAMKDLTPEQVATLQTKQMTLALDLSQAQQSKIQAVNLENAELRKTKMEERKAAKKEGDAKRPTSEERYAMKSEMLDHQIAQKAEMKKILSEDQFEKWTKMKHSKRNHHRGDKDRQRARK